MDDEKNRYETEADIAASMDRDSRDLDALELRHQQRRFGHSSTAEAEAVRNYIDRQRRLLKEASDATDAAIHRQQQPANQRDYAAFVVTLFALMALVVLVLLYVEEG